MREYRFHWQTWVGISILFVLLLLTMLLPDSQVKTEYGTSVMRIGVAKWAVTVNEEIDISRVQMQEGKKIDNDRIIPVLRLWGWMIIIPIMLIIVSITFMIARRRTLSGLLTATGLVTTICEMIMRIRVPYGLYWEKGYAGASSIIVLIFAIITTIYGCLCIEVLRNHDDEVESKFDYDNVYEVHSEITEYRDNKPANVAKVGRIIGIAGEYAGMQLEIHAGEEIVLGRDPAYCMLVYSNKRISRRQCGIRYDNINGFYQAIDYSSNGTMLSDGSLLTTSEYTNLPPGTVLYMAKGQEAIQLL